MKIIVFGLAALLALTQLSSTLLACADGSEGHGGATTSESSPASWVG